MSPVEWFTQLVLGDDWLALGVRFAFLLLVTVGAIRGLIRNRIGPLDAVRVMSYPRLLLGLTVCPLPYLALHLALLWWIPAESPWAWPKYLGLLIVGYFLPAVPICAVGYWVDGGRAIRVLTNRYRPAYPPHLVDMTADHGRSAQLIPRGVFDAYKLLVVITLVAVAIRRAAPTN